MENNPTLGDGLFPIKENIAFVDEGAITTYIRALFGNHQWTDSQFLCARGIGEKGTSQEATFRDEVFIQPAIEGLGRVIDACNKWAQYHVASFVVPCVLKSRSGRADQVEYFTNVLCDLDTGDTNTKLDWLKAHIGMPSMIISSGGTTDQGTPKRHVYYNLEESTADIQQVVKLRDMIAHKVGADPTMGLGVDSNPYGRAHQPVRIAGTCHAKGGIAKSCIFEHLGQPVSLGVVSAGIQRMAFAPWISQEARTTPSAKSSGSISMTGLFSPKSGRSIDESLLNPVYEGGEDVTRWGEFNRVGGFHIRQAREQRISVEEAYNLTHGWALANMHPPFPDHRIQNEFQGLLNKDIATKGAMPSQTDPSRAVGSIPSPICVSDLDVLEKSLKERRFDSTKPPLLPRAIFTFQDEIFATSGNIVCVQAQPKAGKTAFVGALMASTFSKTGDFFGLSSENINGGAVIHFDTEQSRSDHYQGVTRITRRANVISPQGWFRSYALADVSVDDRLKMLRLDLAKAKLEHLAIHSVILDGVADLIADPNDSKETFRLVGELHQLAIQYDTAIICVIHENPDSAFGKTRGHLGSHLERKAETNIRLVKIGVATVVFSEKSRHLHIPKERGSRFRWCNDVGMHVSTLGALDVRSEGLKRKHAGSVEEVFSNCDGLTWSEVHQRLEEGEGLKRPGSRRRFDTWVKLGFIKKGESDEKWYAVK